MVFMGTDFCQQQDSNFLESYSCHEDSSIKVKKERCNGMSMTAGDGVLWPGQRIQCHKSQADELEAMCDHAHLLATVYKDLDCAIEVYIDVIREDTAHVRALANLGALYHKKGELHSARIIYLRALQEEPFRSKTTYNLGRLEHECGHHDDAREMYERALLLDCDEATRSNALAYLGQLQHEVYADPEKAMHCYDHCLARTPAHARTLDFKCALLVGLGRLDEAKALHLRVCALEPHHM